MDATIGLWLQLIWFALLEANNEPHLELGFGHRNISAHWKS